jgi:predicted nucleic acid-binding protein
MVLKRLQNEPVGDVCISVITTAELLYGVQVSRARPRPRPRELDDSAAPQAVKGLPSAP